MARPAVIAWFASRRRQRQRQQEDTPDRLQAGALIHLGLAIRAQQAGDVLLAIRHLSLAAESIAALIELWSGGGAGDADLSGDASL